MLTARRALLLLCLACAAALIRGQDDFDLESALDDEPTLAPTPKKPVPTKKPSSDGGDGFDLGDALGGADIPTKKPAPRPNPGSADDFDLAGALDEDSVPATKKPVPRPNPGGGGGTFGDEDLFDAAGFNPNKPDKPDKPSANPDGGPAHVPTWAQYRSETAARLHLQKMEAIVAEYRRLVILEDEERAATISTSGPQPSRSRPLNRRRKQKRPAATKVTQPPSPHPTAQSDSDLLREIARDVKDLKRGQEELFAQIQALKNYLM